MDLLFDAGVVKKLREMTGAGMMDCKRALTETSGVFDHAVEFLRKKGMDTARKKALRVAKEGVVQAYIHTGNKIGVMVEIDCETDFVARNEDFQQFARNIAMQVAATNPKYVSIDDIPVDLLQDATRRFRADVKEKPDPVVEKIVSGKVKKWQEDICLLEQVYVKDDKKKVSDYLVETISKIGENIVVKRFIRFEVGEGGDLSSLAE